MSQEEIDDIQNFVMQAVNDAFVEYKKKQRGERPHRPEEWSDKVWSWNPPLIVWTPAKGEKGDYERTTQEQNSQSIDYQNMIHDLTDHDGKLTRNGHFYWLFSDQKTVGRKPKRQ